MSTNHPIEKGTTLEKLLKDGHGDRYLSGPAPESGTIFRNLYDGKLYYVYRRTPRMFTGDWLVAERVYFSDGNEKKIPESRLKDYVVVSHRQ